MKNKIIMFVLFIGLFINPVFGNVTIYDTFDFSGSSSVDIDYSTTSHDNYPNHFLDIVLINDIVELQGLNNMIFEIPTSYMRNAPEKSDYDTSIILTIDGDVVGTGIFGYSKSGDDSITFVQLHVWEGELDIGTKTGAKTMYITANTISSLYFYSGTPSEPFGLKHSKPSNEPEHAFFGSSTEGKVLAGAATGTMSISSDYIHTYPYSYTYTPTFNSIYMERNSTVTTKANIKINDIVKVNETDLTIIDLNYVSDDKINNTWIVLMENIYGDIQQKSLIFGIPTYEPTLTTDKTYYNTSEVITISYTNIQTIYDECDNTLCEKGYYISILTKSQDINYDYDKKYETVIPFYYTEYGGTKVFEDGSFTINTSFLYPETEYILGLCGYYGNTRIHEENLLYSKTFYVYPANEYLTISCDSETGCYIYQGDVLNIYYKINNNSNIIIKDNNNNIINQYHNIIDEGILSYTIPEDEYHQLSYPNWKIYLNNTDYSTSFNKDITVYWSSFETPTGTPTSYPTVTPDINISDQIDDLKIEISPLKDLIFGLSSIVIDNPDYNKDNIVDENEINHWFNSLIPLCIIFLFIVLYIGLTKHKKE